MATAPNRSSPPDSPPFYGWRYLRRTRPDGSTELEEVPLTLEDVLHPQEYDKIPESPRHNADRDYLAQVLSTRVPKPGGQVLSECLVDWGVEGILPHCPDIVVFEGLQKPLDEDKATFRLAEYGARCLLVIEVVSPHTRSNDVVSKRDEYHKAGVPLYVLVDQEDYGRPRQILALRHRTESYVLVPPDAQGRASLGSLGLLLGLQEDRAVCYDADTGRRFEDYCEISRALAAIRADLHRTAAP
jgi:Uma2 family endonuclease